MTNFSDALEAIRKRHVYDLADGADVPLPQEPDMAGADLLKAARDRIVEAIDGFEPDDDGDMESLLEEMRDNMTEVMDTVPSVMSGVIWSTYVDLKAYLTDLYSGRYGSDGADDMTRVAGNTLALIAEEVGHDLVLELQQALEEDAEGN